MRFRRAGFIFMLAGLLMGGLFISTPRVRAMGTWSPVTPMQTSGKWYTGTLLPNGDVLAVSAAGAERFVPGSNTWSATGPKATMATGQAMLLPNGRVLVVGAEAAERYDPATNTWMPTAPRAKAAAGIVPAAVLLADGQVLAVAGAQAARYNPQADQWTPVTPPTTPRNNATLTLLADGQVLIAGGSPANCTSAASCNVTIATTERFDPIADRWLPAAAMTTGRVGHTATRLPDGEVLIAGGINAIGATAERYDPAADRWLPAGAVPVSALPATYPLVLAYHQATVLADGRVLVTGGGASSPAAISPQPRSMTRR